MKKMMSVVLGALFGKNNKPRKAFRRRALRLESLESRQLLAVTLGGAEAVDGSDTVLLGDTTEDDIVAIKLDAPETVWTNASTSSVTISWNGIENSDSYTVQWKFTDAEWSEAEIQSATVDEGTAYTLDNLSSGTQVYFRVMANGDNEYYGDSDWSNTVVASTFATTVSWNLADYGYSTYKLDGGGTGAGSWASLYGISDGESVLVATTMALDGNSTLAITGDAEKAEAIEATSGAMQNLPTITFDGGSTDKDTFTIEGSACTDTFTLDSYTVETTVENTSSSASSKSDHGGHGWNSWGWDNWGHNGKNSSKTTTVTTVWSTIGYSWIDGETGATGASLKMTGVDSITIDGGEASDTYVIKSLGTDVILVDGDNDVDSLDFSQADIIDTSCTCGNSRGGNSRSSWGCGWDSWGGWNRHGWRDWGCGKRTYINGVTIDLNSTSAQDIVDEWSGTLTLKGDFDKFVGSENNDMVTGSDITVTETSGTNKIVLTGGTNTVNLASSNNCVTATGDSTNTITATGDNNKIDLSGTKSTDTEANSIITVEGSNNSVVGSDGDDIIVVKGSNAKVDGGNGNDYIDASGSTGRNTLNGGSGNDFIIGGSGSDRIDGGVGRNILIGGTGADRISCREGGSIMIANTTNLLSAIETWNYEEQKEFIDNLYKAWVDDADMDATVALLGETSVSDGSCDKLGITCDWGFFGCHWGHEDSISKSLFYGTSSEGDRIFSEEGDVVYDN